MSGEFQILQMIIQAGAVGISIALIWLIKKNNEINSQELSAMTELLANHMSHVEATIQELKNEIQQSNELKGNIKLVLGKNTSAYAALTKAIKESMTDTKVE